MPGCDVTRRDVLRWSAAAAIAPFAINDFLRSCDAGDGAGSRPVSPANLELVTLTEDTAVITWYTGYTGSDDGLGRMEPAPAEGEVRWGTRPDRLNRVTGDAFPGSPFHEVILRGLEPGRTYFYEARSGGQAVPPTPFTLIAGNPVGTSDHGLGAGGPYSFTAPQPPPGRHLFSVVLCNDLHMGETWAGLVGGIPQIKGISQVPGRPPYPELMLESMVDGAKRLGATYLLAAGDITSEAAPVDVSRTGELLGAFGDHRCDYFVTRGNHDRAHDGDAYATCSVGRWQGHDCFADHYFPDGRPTWFERDLHGLRIIGLDTYDKPGNGGDPGALGTDQLDWFRTTLAEEREQPTIVFGHHPLQVPDILFNSAGNRLDPTQAGEILTDYGATPGVFLHHAGHTHRNHRSVSPVAPGVVHQEVAAVKEYPGGFTLLRIHSGGYALNFHKSRSDLAREWNERSRQEIAGLWPQFALGASVADRNSVVARDLSGIRPVRRRHRGRRDRPPRPVGAGGPRSW